MSEVVSPTVLDQASRELLFTQARTANSFSDTPVTDEQLTAIWELAKWPPTAANTQPMRIVFVRTPEGKARLVPHMADNNADKTAQAPVTAILAYDKDFHEHMPALFPARGEAMKEQMAANPQRDVMAGYNAALQAAYFILAVRAEGLAAGPMKGYDAAGIDKEFFPDGRFVTHLVVNIGYPGENPWFPRLPRLDHETTLDWA